MKASQILLNFTDLNSARPLSGVYVLCGARARRITAVAQQHRAISLIEAMINYGILKAGTTIGVIGGGIAGCTAAYWAVCNGAAVTLYEKGPQLLDVYSKASHRYLHPGLFNWPHPGWGIQHTNLPCLNWSFNTAQHVGNLLRKKMEELRRGVGTGLLTVEPNALCHLQPDAGGRLLRIVQPNGYFKEHQVVVVAVGEGDYDGGGPGYWDADADKDLFDGLRQGKPTQAVVIGNGDGGIMEVLRMKTPIGDERAILKCLERWKNDTPGSLAAVEAYFGGPGGSEGSSAINAGGIQSAWGRDGDAFWEGYMHDADCGVQAWQESLAIKWYSKQPQFDGSAAPLFKLLLAAQQKFSGEKVEFFNRDYEANGEAKPVTNAVLCRFRGQAPLGLMDSERKTRTTDNGCTSLVSYAQGRQGMSEGDFFPHWYLFKSKADIEAIKITPEMRLSPVSLLDTFKQKSKERCLEAVIPFLPIGQPLRRASAQDRKSIRVPLLHVYTPLKIRESKAASGGRNEDSTKQPFAGHGHDIESPALGFIEAFSPAAEGPLRRVLMGAGGRGKSTLTHFLTYSILSNDDANAWADDELRAEAQRIREGWQQTLPVMIRLRDLPARMIREAQSAEDLVLGSVFAICMGWSLEWRDGASKNRHRLAFESFREDMLMAMQGKYLLILDGMDEIVPDTQRKVARLLKDAVGKDGKLASWDIVVTARTASVLKGPNKGWYSFLGWSAWEVQTLSAVDDSNGVCQQVNFARRYLKALNPRDDGMADGLLNEVRARGLQELAGEPLLLGAMAYLYVKSARPCDGHAQLAPPRLPGTRVEVLQATMDLLIDAWDEDRKVAYNIRLLIADAPLEPEVPKRVLGQIASKCLIDPAEDNKCFVFPCFVGADSLFEKLKEEFGNVNVETAEPDVDAYRMTKAFAERIGLFQFASPGTDGSNDSLQFTHAMYASCLAGLYWATEPGRFESALQSMTRNAKALASDQVRQAVALGLAGLKLGLDKPAGQRQPSMARVFPLLEALERRARQATDNEVRRGLYDTLGDAIKELGIAATDLSMEEARSRERLEVELHKVFASNADPVRTRLKVGRALGWIGDGRPQVAPYSMVGHAAAMLWTGPIKARDFKMGSLSGDGGDAYEQPQFDCKLVRHEFRLGRFPVTVQQFREFERVGYQPEALVKYWTVHGREFAEGTRKPDYSLIRDETNRKAYQNWVESDRYPLTGHRVIEGDYETPNAPVVGVSWYEAVAFCNWLNAHFTPEQLGLPKDWQVRLPTEAEWELAASYRGGKKKLYPWGIDKDVEGRANCNKAVEFTSAVGSFGELGRAECGAEDMIGNVWEWCSTGWTDDYNDYERQEHVRDELSAGGGKARRILEKEMLRVVRGGSWWSGSDVCRASYRSWVHPEFRDGFVGFRLAASPISGLW
ncbi:MAG: formylglycine-generating enzyme family protein [Verrucomicrobiota bacterium]|jgi:formylglycine-generating enzyme required for sulfatase activity